MPRAVPWWNGLGNLRRMPPRMGAAQGGRPAWKATLRCIDEESVSYGWVSGGLMPRAVPRWNGLGNLRRMPPRMGAWQPEGYATVGAAPGGAPPGRLRYGASAKNQ